MSTQVKEKDSNAAGDEEVEPNENLEEEWKLDDAQAELVGDQTENAPADEHAEDAFIRTHPISEQPGKLPLPVILPQRRPKARARGFIRAYAPVLENAGIDQTTWLSFLNLFQKSSAANPWLNAINLASFAALAVPHFAGQAIGFIVGQIVELSMEFDSREKTNTFLKKMNTEFFQPRGLYCLVMTYNPNSSGRVEQVNLSDTIASRSENVDTMSDKYRRTDGTTRGEMSFPQSAPLVFPDLDQLAAETGKEGENKQNAIVQKMAYVGKYWDKRATAQYAIGNANTPLAQIPQPEFQSRYADPKTHAASGSLISFVSGGKLVPNPESRGLIGGLINVAGQAIRGEKQGSGWHRTPEEQAALPRWGLYGRGFAGKYSTNYGGAISRAVVDVGKAGYDKLMGKNVLYLMVVNMPSQEELAAARAQRSA